MTTTRSDRLIEQYIDRLVEAAASLPATDRDQLIGDIRERIAIALEEEEEHVDEATIRNLLDRLGALHVPGVDLPIDSPIPLPRRPSTVPLFAMGPVGAAYLGWRLVVGLRAHSSPSARDTHGATP